MADISNGADPTFTIERLNNWKLRNRQHYITFRITNDKVNYDYRMHLMPEQYTLDRPARTTIVQTRGGQFIDDFGLGIGTLSISGTTGFRRMPNNSPAFNPPTTEDESDGMDRWRGLVKLFETWYQFKRGDTTQEWWMHFLNWSEEDHYLVWPIGLPKLVRNVREPLLFRYEIQLTVLKKISDTNYLTPGESPGDTQGDVVADLATRAAERAPLIGLRMEEQQENLQILVGHILNGQDLSDFDPLNPGDNPFGELPDDLKDAATQGFIDDLLRRQAPANYSWPTDSNLGVLGRTRTLADKIQNYATGKTAKIDTTIGEVQATVKGWRDVLDAAEYAVNLPVVFAREIRETLCSVQSLLLYPQLFRNSVSAALTELADLLLDSGCATTLKR